jgi:hypothetical protein
MGHGERERPPGQHVGLTIKKGYAEKVFRMTAEFTLPADRVTQVAGLLAERVRLYDAAKDHRAVFAYTYYRLTMNLATGLRTDGRQFIDPSWVADLCDSLASAYFTVMDSIDTWLEGQDGGSSGEVHSSDLPESIPQPWRDVFAASSSRRSYVLEDLMFSIMAHMSYDLPETLRRMATPTGIRNHIADFHRMNDVLAASIDEIQDQVAARYCRQMASLDRLFTTDELMTNYGIRVVRGLAWYNCDRLLDPAATEYASRSISRSTAAMIAAVRSPGDWKLRIGYGILRRLIPARRQWPATDAPIA